MDQPSEVASYIMSVYHLETFQDVLLEDLQVTSTSYNETGARRYNELTELPAEGPYSFVLQTLDHAGNMRFSRRLVLFDNSSTLTIEPSEPLVVTSAVPQTMYRWQNSTSDPIVVSGQGHFYNSHLRSNAWLAPVGNRFNVSQDYDHPFAEGEFPREGTPNALGIVRVDYDYIIDQMGEESVQSLMPPDSFRFSSADLAIDAISVDPDLQDGDSVRVWFLVYDYNSEQVNDSVVVHVDSSSPDLRDLSLVRNGISGLALHHTVLLTDLVVEFDALDEHSGVLSIGWEIGTTPGMDDVGRGDVAVERVAMETCAPPECICNRIGECTFTHYTFSPSLSELRGSTLARHDAEYYITITATNHAHLSSQLSLVFTVDATPPLPGVVFDGTPQEADVDYERRGQELRGWWVGFFDRESDVIFYQYLFAEECGNRSAFVYPLPAGSVIMETNLEEATAMPQGKAARGPGPD